MIMISGKGYPECSGHRLRSLGKYWPWRAPREQSPPSPPLSNSRATPPQVTDGPQAMTLVRTKMVIVIGPLRCPQAALIYIPSSFKDDPSKLQYLCGF